MPSSKSASLSAENVRPNRRSTSVTVNDVARIAGVSAMTVSRVVNTPENVPEATLANVRQAIAMSGYVPNLLAGGLRSKRSRLVAALVPTLVGPVFSESVQALTVALSERGYQLMLGQSGYADSREDDLLGAIIGRRPDGIVLTGVTHSDNSRRRLMAAGIPVVETWDLTPTPIDMLVGFSHTAVAEAVCRRLYAAGRRCLAIISADDERALRRTAAFLEAARTLGVRKPVVYTVAAPATSGGGRSGLHTLLLQDPDIDGVFCSSDLLALGLLTEAQALGIKIPDQISVIGFGDVYFSRDLHPALTTVRIDGTRMGQEAARCIVERVEGCNVDKRVIDIGFALVERASV